MKIVVYSHKPVWCSRESSSGYATDGGFVFHMQALAGLFDELRVLVPVAPMGASKGEIPFPAGALVVVPLAPLWGRGVWRKLLFPFWLLRNAPTLLGEFFRADGVHTPIPGDVGTVGMLLAWLFRKPLYVRHCGNWLKPQTGAEKFWRWFMEFAGGGQNLMLATGGAPTPPSPRNPSVQWIFSSSLWRREIAAVARPRTLPLDRPLRLILVARQETAKGGGRLIESLRWLSADFPGIEAWIVGDGGAIPGYRKLSAELGLEAQVRFPGKVNHEEVLGLLHDCDLFVFPTTSSDGFPKAVLEAMATGLPVVATRVSVLPSLLGEGVGLLLDSAEPVEVARGIRSALSDRGRYEDMSRKSVCKAQQYSLETWAETIGSHLQTAWGATLSTGRIEDGTRAAAVNPPI